MTQSSRQIKVAVVGSGLAGLTAAWLLSTKVTSSNGDNVEFECHLFEKESEIGMDASSVSIPRPDSEGKLGSEWRIDVPMRSFQGGYYRELIRMYTALGVAFREADFSYSFSRLPQAGSGIKASMIYNGASGRAGVGIPAGVVKRVADSTLLARIWIFTTFIVGVVYLLLNYTRLLVYSFPLFRPTGSLTLHAWVQRATPTGFIPRLLGLDRSWKEFTTDILVPLFSAVCTAPFEDILNHPVEELLEFAWLTFGTHHFMVSNGVREVVNKLSARIQHIHLASPIVSLADDPASEELLAIQCLSDGKRVTHSGFRHVVFATQANTVVQILKSYPSDGRLAAGEYLSSLTTCLSSFSYRRTVVVNHTDSSLLPDDPRDWRDLNLISRTSEPPPMEVNKNPEADDNCLPASYTMATHALLGPRDCHVFPRILQTTNPTIPPQLSSILSVARLERAIVTAQSKIALQRLSQCARSNLDFVGSNPSVLGDLQGGKPGLPSIWICGSYAFHGIPLLEGCVRSARDVVELGIHNSESVHFSEPPW